MPRRRPVVFVDFSVDYRHFFEVEVNVVDVEGGQVRRVRVEQCAEILILRAALSFEGYGYFFEAVRTAAVFYYAAPFACEGLGKVARGDFAFAQNFVDSQPDFPAVA